MSRFAFFLLAVLANAAQAQGYSPAAPAAQAPRAPTADEQAFARLPADVRQMLSGMTAAQAMQTVQLTSQHLIALGVPNPSPEQFRATLRAVLAPPSSSVGSASAGATSFPPLSPLVAPPPPAR